MKYIKVAFLTARRQRVQSHYTVNYDWKIINVDQIATLTSCCVLIKQYNLYSKTFPRVKNNGRVSSMVLTNLV